MATLLLNRLLLLLDRKPDYGRVLERMAEDEEERLEEARAEERVPFLGVERREIGAPQRLLDELVWEGVIKLVYASRSHAPYLLVDREETKRALAAWQPREGSGEEEREAPRDLFAAIAGHERIKRFFALSLAAPRPVHGLLVGPAATAKSLFLEELRRLPRARYIDGAIASKAGIVEYVLAEEPRYLLVDQVDHLGAEDQQVLHGLMATGRVARLKHAMKEDEIRLVAVYGTANSTRRLSETLLDRFQTFVLAPYSAEEFREAVRAALIKWEGTEAEVANYIGALLSRLQNPTIREAVRLARVARSVQEVDEALRVFHGA